MTDVLFTVLFQEGKRRKEGRKGGGKALVLVRAVYETIFTRITVNIMVLKRKECMACRK